MAILSLDEATGLVAAALERNDTSAENARIVAQALVAAEADGLKGHGLSRVASYATQAKVGKVKGHAVPEVTRPKPGVVAVDAGYGFAFPAIARAIEALCEVTPQQGVAAAAVRRSHHCGAAGHPVEQLAERGLMALLFANTPAAMAPWGGSKAVFGTNPIAFACPLPDAPPIVVDMSLSKVARGVIINARQRGEKTIPEGWAMDAEGKPTTDVDAALKGTMVPMGDAKGTALALMVELLAAGLVGATYAADASSFMDATGGPPGTGQLLLAFDPMALGGEGTLAHFAVLARSIEEQPGARLPGTRRLGLRQKAREQGLDIPDSVVQDIRSL